MSDADTQTFAALVFTDIVGSSEFKTRYGDFAFREADKDHNTIFTNALKFNHRGAEALRHVGDSYLVKFQFPTDAVVFALRFQKALDDKVWAPEPILVRIGMHFGPVIQVLDPIHQQPDVSGLAADIGGKICTLAAGKQILMTETVFTNVWRELTAPTPIRGLKNPEKDRLDQAYHGLYAIQGYSNPVGVYEIGFRNIAHFATPIGSAKAHPYSLGTSQTPIDNLISNASTISADLQRIKSFQSREVFELSISFEQETLSPAAPVKIAGIATSPLELTPVILASTAGGGKSTMLASVFQWALNERIAGRRNILPIYLNLSDFLIPAEEVTHDSFKAWLLATVGHIYGLNRTFRWADLFAVSHTSRNSFKLRLLTAIGKLYRLERNLDWAEPIIFSEDTLFLLDGLNDVSPKRRQGVLNAVSKLLKLNQGKVLLTCRTLELAELNAANNYRLLEIQPVANAKDYLSNAELTRLAAMTESHVPEVRQILSSPLYLKIILSLVRKLTYRRASLPEAEEEIIRILQQKDSVGKHLMAFHIREVLATQTVIPPEKIVAACTFIVRNEIRKRKADPLVVGAKKLELNPWFFVESLSPSLWNKESSQALIYRFILGTLCGAYLGTITAFVTLAMLITGHLTGQISLELEWPKTFVSGVVGFVSILLSFLLCARGVRLFRVVWVPSGVLLGIAIGVSFAAARSAVFWCAPFLSDKQTTLDLIQQFTMMAPVSATAVAAVCWWLKFDPERIELARPKELIPHGSLWKVLLPCVGIAVVTLAVFFAFGDEIEGVALASTLFCSFAWFFIHRDKNAKVSDEDNQGVRDAMQRSVRMGAGVTTFAAITHLLVWGYNGDWYNGVVNMLLALCLINSVLAFGGFAVLQHYALRISLIVRRKLSFDLPRHLRVAADIGILHRVGGGFIFFHPHAGRYFQDLLEDGD